jgi:hypothetical protein
MNVPSGSPDRETFKLQIFLSANRAPPTCEQRDRTFCFCDKIAQFCQKIAQFCQKIAQFCKKIAQNGALLNKIFCLRKLLIKTWKFEDK